MFVKSWQSLNNSITLHIPISFPISNLTTHSLKPLIRHRNCSLRQLSTDSNFCITTRSLVGLLQHPTPSPHWHILTLRRKKQNHCRMGFGHFWDRCCVYGRLTKMSLWSTYYTPTQHTLFIKISHFSTQRRGRGKGGRRPAASSYRHFRRGKGK